MPTGVNAGVLVGLLEEGQPLLYCDDEQQDP